MWRYRTGIDRHTGTSLTGWAHVAQCVDDIVSTMFDARVLRLDYGCDLPCLIGKPLTPALLLEFYRKAVTAVHTWEPEFRVRRLDVMNVERSGGLRLFMRGLYYPEGRFGNYDAVEDASTAVAMLARRAA